MSDDLALELDPVVAVVAAVNQVEVNRVDCIGKGDLHVPVGLLAGIVPADVPEYGHVRFGSLKTEGNHAVAVSGAGPVDDGER